jgi:hypothetical protein
MVGVHQLYVHASRVILVPPTPIAPLSCCMSVAINTSTENLLKGRNYKGKKTNMGKWDMKNDYGAQTWVLVVHGPWNNIFR